MPQVVDRNAYKREILEYVHVIDDFATETWKGQMDEVWNADEVIVCSTTKVTAAADTLDGKPVGMKDRDLFHKLHNEGTTLIVVTHDPEVAEVAQRTVYLRNGKLHKETINENFTGEIKFDNEVEL